MPTLELIELYPSPWSERLRWVLETKGLPYQRTPFVPLAGSDEHQRKTGIATVPVLIADGEIIGDSDRAVDWLETTHPSPELLPSDPRRRAQVRAWELLATEVLAPAGRLLMIGRMQAMGLQPLGDYFATKYHWNAAEEGRVGRLLQTVLPELAAAVTASPHLVGDGFTRADLTLAALLTPILGLPADDVFAIDPGTRMMFSSPLGDDPALAPLQAWRERTYRAHRGGRVQPPTS